MMQMNSIKYIVSYLHYYVENIYRFPCPSNFMNVFKNKMKSINLHQVDLGHPQQMQVNFGRVITN